jgi:hypothetical protein
VAALRAAGYDDAAFYRSAPETMATLALLYRQAGDFAAADAIYSSMMMVNTPEDLRFVRGRAIMLDEQALLAHGVTRPEPGALLVDLRDAPGEGGPYRLGQWLTPDCSPVAPYSGRSALVLYRQDGATVAAVGNAVRAEGSAFAFETDGWGSDLTGDGRRTLPITEANGGNCNGCSSLRLFVAGPAGLAELSIGAPDFVIPRTLARIGGRWVVVTYDGRWDGFGDVCRGCSPGVAVVLAWRGGRFEQACRQVPDFYRQRLGELRQGLADRDPQVRFGAITSRLLVRIQIGEAEQAWPEYREALAALRRVRGSPRNAFSTAENQLAAALRAARPQLASAACPVNALTMR